MFLESDCSLLRLKMPVQNLFIKSVQSAVIKGDALIFERTLESSLRSPTQNNFDARNLHDRLSCTDWTRHMPWHTTMFME